MEPEPLTKDGGAQAVDAEEHEEAAEPHEEAPEDAEDAGKWNKTAVPNLKVWGLQKSYEYTYIHTYTPYAPGHANQSLPEQQLQPGDHGQVGRRCIPPA